MFGMFEMTDDQFYAVLLALLFVIVTFGGAFINWMWPL